MSRRINAPELMDQAWWPDDFRNAHTEYLRWLMKREGVVRVLIEHLSDISSEMDSAGSVQIVDLCSGSGGPWFDIVSDTAEDPNFPALTVLATDKYPAHVSGTTAGKSSIEFAAEPLTADQAISEREADIFTIVNGFHHLSDGDQRALIQSIGRDRKPLLIAEMTDPSLRTIISVLPAPIAFVVFAVTNTKRLNTRQLVFSTLIPVLPFVALWDAFASCLRSSTHVCLRDLMKSELPEAKVVAGRGRTGAVPVTWAIATFPR